MKKIYIFTICMAIVFMSNKGGRPVGVTGAPGESGQVCATCHNGGNFNTNIEISLANANGDVVTEYLPGQEYDLTVTVSGNNAVGYGFQLVPLSESNNNMAGDWSDLGDDVRLQDDLGRSYIVQSDRKADGIFTAKWTAPSEGTGSVKFYSAGIAANGNNGTTGDDATQTSISFGEGTSTSTEELDFNVNLYPNPTTEVLYVNAETEVEYSIISVSGQSVMSSYTQSKDHTIDVSSLSNGVYMISLRNEDQNSTKCFVKR